MKIGHWKMVIGLRRDIANLLERTVVHSARPTDRVPSVPTVPTETLERMRSELKTQLDTLKDNLSREMGENEVYLVMFPLVLLCDEMVMTHLPKHQQTAWALLQSDLFQINYGGDVFYDFVDERLSKPDTPSIVFEVLFYCLTSGFVGKFGSDGSKVLRYKALICERIPGAINPVRRKKRRRDANESPMEHSTSVKAVPLQTPKPRSNAWYYLGTFGILTLFVLCLWLFSNV